MLCGFVCYQPQLDPDVPIMFTRLDSERNGKIMKRAVNGDKLDREKYKVCFYKFSEK